MPKVTSNNRAQHPTAPKTKKAQLELGAKITGQTLESFLAKGRVNRSNQPQVSPPTQRDSVSEQPISERLAVNHPAQKPGAKNAFSILMPPKKKAGVSTQTQTDPQAEAQFADRLTCQSQSQSCKTIKYLGNAESINDLYDRLDCLTLNEAKRLHKDDSFKHREPEQRAAILYRLIKLNQGASKNNEALDLLFQLYFKKERKNKNQPLTSVLPLQSDLYWVECEIVKYVAGIDAAHSLKPHTLEHCYSKYKQKDDSTLEVVARDIIRKRTDFRFGVQSIQDELNKCKARMENPKVFDEERRKNYEIEAGEAVMRQIEEEKAVARTQQALGQLRDDESVASLNSAPPLTQGQSDRDSDRSEDDDNSAGSEAISRHSSNSEGPVSDKELSPPIIASPITLNDSNEENVITPRAIENLKRSRNVLTPPTTPDKQTQSPDRKKVNVQSKAEFEAKDPLSPNGDNKRRGRILLF